MERRGTPRSPKRGIGSVAKHTPPWLYMLSHWPERIHIPVILAQIVRVAVVLTLAFSPLAAPAAVLADTPVATSTSSAAATSSSSSAASTPATTAATTTSASTDPTSSTATTTVTTST